MPGTLLRATCRALQTFRGLHNQRPFCGLACTTALRNEKSPQQKRSHVYDKRKFSNRFEGLFKSQVRAIDTAPKDSPEVLLSPDVEHLTLNWGEGDIRLSGTWLRHNCHCDLCKQDFSGQRILDVAKLKPPCLIQDAYVQNGDVHILWQGESDHLGKIPLDFLVNNHYTKEKLTYEQRQRDPVYLTGDVPYMHYDELQTPQGVLKWLCHLNEVGLCVMRGVPQETGMVEKVAEKIWPIQYTIYGTVFDVVSTPEPINAAYSTVHLAFHTDLAYYQSAPGIQFLHCIRFDQCVQGGDSIFVDAWHTAEEMRHSHPKHFATLCRVPATFQKIHYKRERPVHMTYQRPHIILNDLGTLTAVNWAPQFEGPLAVPEEDIGAYFDAYHLFARMLEASATYKQLKLEEGDLVAFNNRRVLHGRTEFVSNGGHRFLQGCYVNLDEFKSQVEVFSRLYGDGKPAKRVGNEDYM